MITAVCVSAIPPPETRKIVGLEVFAVTATSSIMAYLWMLFILKGHSPEKVDISEGVITFCLFPLLLMIAFAADKNWLCFCCRRRPEEADLGVRARSKEWIDK